MHLLVINEFFWPDVCASSAVLTDHLPRIKRLRPDWRITVLTGNRAWDKPELTWPARESWNGIDIVRVPRPAVGRSLWKRGTGFLGFHRSVLRIGRTLDRPDVIMSSTAPPCGGRLGDNLARHFNCKHIYRVLDLYPDCATTLGVLRGIAGRYVANRWLALDTQVMSNAAAVVTISQGLANRIRRTRAIPSGRLHTIHDGFDPDRVRPIPHEQNAFRRQCGLDGKFVVQYAGNMGLSHPMDTLLEAAKQLAGDARIAFQFIGSGPARATIERAISSQRSAISPNESLMTVSVSPRSSSQSEIGNRQSEIRTGHGPLTTGNLQLFSYQPADRLAELLGTADVSLISQDARMAELSLPYKFYSILASGRPCIFVGSAVSEIVPLLKETQCGIHIEQSDAAGLAREIRRLAADDSLRADMGRRARQLFEGRFTSDKAAAAWIELIEAVDTAAS